MVRLWLVSGGWSLGFIVPSPSLSLPKGKRGRPYADQGAGMRAQGGCLAAEYKRRKLAKLPAPLGSRTNINRAGRVPNGMSPALPVLTPLPHPSPTCHA